MAYGTPVAIVGDSSSFCLPCARKRYGEAQVNYFVNHDAVFTLRGRDGEVLEVAREGMHDRFLCGLTCECGQALCPYAEYGCECVCEE
jgi:hypothetical protein